MKGLKSTVWILLFVFLAGCQTKNLSEAPSSQDDYWTLMFHADSLLADGLCPLLDASRVNEWRKEVGMPPIDIK